MSDSDLSNASGVASDCTSIRFGLISWRKPSVSSGAQASGCDKVQQSVCMFVICCVCWEGAECGRGAGCACVC